jgi:hypothetical protein
MKHFVLVLSLLLAGVTTTLAQVASDYYTPLAIGSHVTLYTIGSVGSSWAYRTTTYVIEGSDSITGQLCYREKGKELWGSLGESSVFRVFWLRTDVAGNVVMGAMNTDGIDNPDSATIVNSPLFPNEFLVAGYSRSYPVGNGTYKDSVLSTNETVSTPAGTFSNCLYIQFAHFDSAATKVFCENQYYAFGIGIIKNVRTLPVGEEHTDELVEYSSTATASPLLGTWMKSSGPSSVSMYNYTSNSDLSLLMAGSPDTTLTGKYVLDASATPHRISWYLDGTLVNLGIWSLSGDILTVQASGNTTAFPSSFSNPSQYIKQATGVQVGTSDKMPRQLSLSQNYPNPFNPTTVISVQLTVDSRVHLVVYDLLGREVSVLADGMMTAGLHSATWNAQNVSSGMYFARLVVTDAFGKQLYIKTMKMMLMK